MRIHFLFLLFSFGCLAQKQGNIWYFGNYAGIDFNGGTPVALLNGQLGYPSGNAHNEGTSVISDNLGSLLYYTNGETVWNKIHNVMLNGTGLLGNFSSTQSSVIVPQPGFSDQFFYVFTVSSGFCCNGSISDGLRYSKIDACGDNGLGEIMSTEKNIKLVDTVAEKIAVTRHSNGQDYWILTHKFFSDQFWALRFSSAGIVDTVITSIGTIHSGNIAGSMGQLKFSPNGQRVGIAADNSLDILEVFDFDNNTGVLSNFMPLYKPSNDNASIYGIEFSPDNSKLYASGRTSSGLMYPFLIQYDLSAGGGTLSSINASMTVIYQNTVGLISGKGLQLGPDGKIYWVALNNDTTLSVIHNPNVAGVSCNFQDEYLSLAGREGSFSLPTFVSGYDYSNSLNPCAIGLFSSLQSNLKFYPNPVNDLLIFECTDAQIDNILIYNCSGVPILSKKGVDNEFKISTKDIPSGLYYFQARNKMETLFSKTFLIEK